MVALGVAVTLTAVALDLLVSRELSLLFDLVFVLLCVGAALLVRQQDFFVVGVLPPLLMLGLFVLLGLVSPGVVAEPQDGLIQAVVSGLAHHAATLVTGYFLALGVLAMRQHVLANRSVQSSNRLGSPAPTRSTSGTPSE